MSELKNYCLCILHSYSRDLVAVVRKARPEWQRGYYNFPGGHIEAGETPRLAAIREAEEETGIVIADNLLRNVDLLQFEKQGSIHTRLHVFAYAVPDPLPVLRNLDHTEPVGWVSNELVLTRQLRMIDNLPWLLAKALYESPNVPPSTTTYVERL